MPRRWNVKRGYILEKELSEERLKSGGIPALMRAIINATHEGGQIKVSFWSETGRDDAPLVNWEIEDES